MISCDISKKILWYLCHYQGFRRVAERIVEDAIAAMNDPCAIKQTVTGVPYVYVSNSANRWTHLDCIHYENELLLR